MNRRVALALLLAASVFPAGAVAAQEADSGLDLRATLTAQSAASTMLTESPRNGAPMAAGFHGVLYPTWKMTGNWFASGAVQLATRPYYYSDFNTMGYGAKGTVLQAALNFAKVWRNGSVLVRAGELPTAFGAFPLHYDDAENALVDLPVPYGYYYAPVSIAAVTGAQVDATRGRWDGRVQLANSSPANPQSPFGGNQYANWTGGAGFTIRQGFRVGVSAYRGPYLDDDDPGAWKSPSHWPARAAGLDATWTHGHTSANAELQRFVLPYSHDSTTREWAGYGELKQVLTPRWFVAARYGETGGAPAVSAHIAETGAGFRPNRLQLIKVSYQLRYGAPASTSWYGGWTTSGAAYDHTVSIQLVTSLHAAFAPRATPR